MKKIEKWSFESRLKNTILFSMTLECTFVITNNNITNKIFFGQTHAFTINLCPRWGPKVEGSCSNWVTLLGLGFYIVGAWLGHIVREQWLRPPTWGGGKAKLDKQTKLNKTKQQLKTSIVGAWLGHIVPEQCLVEAPTSYFYLKRPNLTNKQTKQNNNKKQANKQCLVGPPASYLRRRKGPRTLNLKRFHLKSK